jgi:prefoldin subunit 5
MLFKKDPKLTELQQRQKTLSNLNSESESCLQTVRNMITSLKAINADITAEQNEINALIKEYQSTHENLEIQKKANREKVDIFVEAFEGVSK